MTYCPFKKKKKTLGWTMLHEQKPKKATLFELLDY